MPSGSDPLRPPVVPVRRLLPTPSRRLPVAVADGRPTLGAAEGPALVCFPGFRTALDDLELQRLGVVAERTGRLVATVETPGYGSRPAPLRAGQRAGLWRGDFGPLADEMLAAAAEALRAVTGSGEPTPVTLVGFSMGASTASAAARVCRAASGAAGPARDVGGAELRLVLVEPVAAAPTWVTALALADYADYRHLDDDLAGNRRLGWARPPDLRRRRAERTRVHARRGDLAALAVGLSHGRIARDLAHAARIRPMQVDIVRGERSHLVPRERAKALRSSLDAAGCPGRLLELPGRYHAVWRDLPGVAAIVDALGLDLPGGT